MYILATHNFSFLRKAKELLVAIKSIYLITTHFLSRLPLTNCLGVMSLILGGWQRSKRPPVKTLHALGAP